MAIAIAIPLALAATGTTLAVTASVAVAEQPPIRELLPPKPSPSSDSQLPEPVQKVVDEAAGEAEGGETEQSDPAPRETGSSSAERKESPKVASSSGYTWSWNVAYGGWRRFLTRADGYTDVPSKYTTSVPVQPIAPDAPTLVTPVAASVPRNPAFLWVLLPLGLMLVWAAGLAVFEPAHDGGGVRAFVGSVRRSARELPAGMTRSVARIAVHGVRRFRPWHTR
ncbi:MAG: hypothetical protein ABR518_10260 [Actinomycetota bacterium]